MIEPLVTVNILSYNRRDDLRITLQKVSEQHYKNIEIIVVDNASSDGTPEMVKLEYTAVRLIQLPANIGIAGWNEGFKIANGEFILVLDDDSYPEKNSIYDLIATARTDETIGIIGSKVQNLLTGKIDLPGKVENNWISFIGCGALIRKNIFLFTGLFSEKLFLYFHEVDFTFRLIDCGFKLVIADNSIIYHINSPKNRNYKKTNILDKRKTYFDTRNTIYLLLTYFTFKKIIFRLIRIVLGKIYFGIKSHLFFNISIAIYDGVKLSISSKSNSILNSRTQRYFKYGAIFGGFYFWNGNYGNQSSR
jgi:GT2 family glycosyltransferase